MFWYGTFEFGCRDECGREHEHGFSSHGCKRKWAFITYQKNEEDTGYAFIADLL